MHLGLTSDVEIMLLAGFTVTLFIILMAISFWALRWFINKWVRGK